ncbi:hypothetical protein PRECH8_09530 [Insulibacter thermoxylanivorax]|uniref:MTTase N-terminal domain-containing protein n=1 Tax=Insulibacter thermoxylanivorax TaxID=2749268 RepID=A0A916VEW6_9BACL|nr:hypothetical protein PRECH8_09530 [Insulibacter thermoxylanivorax]
MTERVKVVTLGCEKNLVDSEIMSGLSDFVDRRFPGGDGSGLPAAVRVC